MKKETVELTLEVKFPKSGKILIKSKDHYASVVKKLIDSNYKFFSGRDCNLDDIPLGVSWYPSTNPKNSGIIRKTKSKIVFIHYFNTSLKNF
jgi:hypothetical protein